MLEKFRDDYNWMLRGSRGYFPWINKNGYRLEKHIFGKNSRNCLRCHDDYNPRELMKIIIGGSVFENKLFDLFFKALLRAEIRLISRFIPQRSHEERLTGNLVSEIDNSLFIIKDAFRETSIDMYSEEKNIDFFYYDLSRGGKIEKQTGADLGFILVVDLPDYPYTVKSIIFQAKKMNGSSQIDRKQYETLLEHGKNYSAYLFYDMNLRSLSSPFVLKTDSYVFSNLHKKCVEANKSSFSVAIDDIFSDGHPLSLFLLSHLLAHSAVGREFSSFENAFRFFVDLSYSESKDNNGISNFNGRLAIASLGKKIEFGVKNL